LFGWNRWILNEKFLWATGLQVDCYYVFVRLETSFGNGFLKGFVSCFGNFESCFVSYFVSYCVSCFGSYFVRLNCLCLILICLISIYGIFLPNPMLLNP